MTANTAQNMLIFEKIIPYSRMIESCILKIFLLLFLKSKSIPTPDQMKVIWGNSE